jgi:hypothetical protein
LEGRLELALAGLDSPKLAVSKVLVEAEWNPPALRLPRLEVELYEGELRAEAGLDVISREAVLQAETTFDLHGIDGLLGPRSRENFVRYHWEEAPWFVGEVRARLPRWTDRQPDWEREVKPTVRLGGQFHVTSGAFKGVSFDQASSSLFFDGQTWRLPDLRTVRAEGRQDIAVLYNEDTREYRIDANGVVLPPILKPVLGEASGEILDLFEFNAPVAAEISVWGPWAEGNSQAILGAIRATNFLFRSQHFDRLQASVSYTNQTLIAAPLELIRGNERLRGLGVRYSFAEDRAWLTNIVSTIEPRVVAAAISPGFVDKLVPYRFDAPPSVRVDGTIRPRDTTSADLAFEIDSGPFHYWRLSAERVETRMLWQNSTLTLTNLQAGFYGGTLEGHAAFDLADPADGRYQFATRIRQADLGAVLREAAPGKSNVVEGRIDLDLTVNSARTSDLSSWNGYGRAELREGLLWDVPIFGFLSPVLNGVIPGLGNIRAERGSATFTLTNGVIHTRDLVIACPPAKLLYRGTLDFEQRVDAKVEGQILSDLGGIGPLVGLLLRPLTKLLEFRVTGTLSDVKADPLYIPKLLLLPLQPVKILKDWFGGGDNKTNAPPAKSGAESQAPPAPERATPRPSG